MPVRAICIALYCVSPLLALSACGASSSPATRADGGATGIAGAALAGANTLSSSGDSNANAGAAQGGSLGDGGAGQMSAAGQTSAAGQASAAGQTSAAGASSAGTAGDPNAGGAPAMGGSSGSGGTGGQSGAGSEQYEPCPPKGTVCRIMPMGDSITEGFRATDNRGGYKSRLFHLTLMNQQSITFVGSAPLWGPNTVDGVPFPKQNEGVGGRRIEDLIDIVPATSTAAKPNTVVVNKPHILLLEIGTNNIHDGATSMSTKLGSLLDLIIASDSQLLVVLAKIIPDRVDADLSTIRAYNDAMPAIVKSRADSGKHIILADMFTPIYSNSNFKTQLMTDDLHPNDAGYTLMAQAWYDVIKSYLR